LHTLARFIGERRVKRDLRVKPLLQVYAVDRVGPGLLGIRVCPDRRHAQRSQRQSEFVFHANLRHCFLDGYREVPATVGASAREDSAFDPAPVGGFRWTPIVSEGTVPSSGPSGRLALAGRPFCITRSIAFSTGIRTIPFCLSFQA